MSLDIDIINAIDARIATVLKQSTTWGTVATRQGPNDALVTFDGTSLAIPVKVAGNVGILEGDRVGLMKIGLWWTVVCTMTSRYAQSEDGKQQSMVTAGTTTSATMVDTSDYCGFTAFVKRWEETAVLLQLTGSCYVDASPTRVDFGVQTTDAKSNVNTYTVCSTEYDTANKHDVITGWLYVSLPAGTYEMHAQWCRPLTGTATLHMNGFDIWSIRAAECMKPDWM